MAHSSIEVIKRNPHHYIFNIHKIISQIYNQLEQKAIVVHYDVWTYHSYRVAPLLKKRIKIKWPISKRKQLNAPLAFKDN